ncbi:MAG: hypothetical protein EKK63_15710 [Acinetobacter sp.]|uniref:hypothetical protein n=1 Tax=Acinetobacter sp. TaxID=472 RepID=UPI000FB96CDB|nr:hypothetical protein [Acinetobacter sp.]RUP37015.1 MAG: hypothetical protein EKK63_15710 [Acinetobacter sp.]
MNNKTKKDLQYLRQLAYKMPSTWYDIKETLSFKGKELIDNGVTKLKDGTRVEANGRYTFTHETQRQTNHYRRLKKMYLSGKSIQQIAAYVNEVVELNMTMTKPITGLNYDVKF